MCAIYVSVLFFKTYLYALMTVRDQEVYILMHIILYYPQYATAETLNDTECPAQ